ncbi:MAG: ferrous iron transport protein B [Ruminococcaceae bacterium]|nr:ferrous iron transport protein B [Oscillospiraceae bacterium]
MAVSGGGVPVLRTGERLIALAGHPNVGKSTVFNAMTGMRQHTGNWAGKTVANAFGRYDRNGRHWVVADLPGCCSLAASSAEEKAARDFIFNERPDVIVVVCSAVNPERGMALVLQTLELTSRVVVCVNLLDEAAKKGMEPDLGRLEERLGVPVVGVTARSGRGLNILADVIESVANDTRDGDHVPVRYPMPVEAAIARLLPDAERVCPMGCSPRWLALRTLDEGREGAPEERLLGSRMDRENFFRRVEECRRTLEQQGIDSEALGDILSASVSEAARGICSDAAPASELGYSRRDRILDRLLTGRVTGWLVMLMMLAVVLWITLEGANYLSAGLSVGFNKLEHWLQDAALSVGMPAFLRGLLLSGAFRVMGWVVAVMLPPMAIFFPLFTLLEDAGYLPRVAFNLDGGFRRCGACGKQALTMCMGLGCNAAGVTGCRIISSPRERLVAVLTNSFVPCNGRFPTMLAIISLFLAGSFGTLCSAVLLAGFIAVGIVMTLLVSRLLTATILRGQSSSFTLELPSYRRPQVCRTLARSLADRTFRVLGRAVMVALPAGAVIWLLANVNACGGTLLDHVTGFLDPLGRIMGMDGVTLTAFVLGFPANELVLPVAMMTYSAQGELMEIGSMQSFGAMLTANGWDWATAVSVLLFTLMHWPCSTTCITIYKETGSIKWTLLGFLLPTLCGFVCCSGFTLLVSLIGG